MTAVVFMPMNVELTIIAIAMAYACFSVFLQVRLIDRRRMRELQQKIKQHNKELNVMMKSGAPREQIDAKQKEMMPHLQENLKGSLKPSFVIIPVFLILTKWAIPAGFAPYANQVATFIIPIVNFSPTALFFYYTLIFGFVSTAALLLYDKKKMREEWSAAEAVKPS